MNLEIDKIKAVIFDTEMVYLKVWSEVFEKYGYKMTKEIYASVLGTGRENVKKVFLHNFGNDLPIDIMYKEKDEELAKAVEKGIPLKNGAYEMLTYLRENNFKIALATSAVKETKPNPEIFLKAAENLDINPKECIVIEDSSAGIKAAFNAGMTAFHVVDLKKADEKILSSAYKSFNNLNEIRSELMSIK